MPASLQSLTEGTRELAVPYEDDPAAVTVWYRPGSFSTKIERAVHDLAETGDSDLKGPKIIGILLAVITRWDLPYDTKGKIVPLTDEGLEPVPLSFLMAIVNAIGEDQNPKEAIEEPSSDA